MVVVWDRVWRKEEFMYKGEYKISVTKDELVLVIVCTITMLCYVCLC